MRLGREEVAVGYTYPAGIADFTHVVGISLIHAFDAELSRIIALDGKQVDRRCHAWV